MRGNMPDKLDGGKRISVSPSSPKKDRKPTSDLPRQLACRLRAIQAELGQTNGQMAAMVGVGITTWSNWLNAENRPDEEAMIRLCDQAGVTMEWLYRGRTDGMNVGHAIRLTARTKGIDPNAALLKVLAKETCD